MLVYYPVVLDVFGSFIISRRLDTIKKFIKTHDITRVLIMLEEMFDNLNHPLVKSDFVEKETLLEYLFDIIEDIKTKCVSIQTLEDYIEALKQFVDKQEIVGETLW